MLLNHKVLALVKAASTDSTRESITGVRVNADGSGVATDGFILVKFTPASHDDPKYYPAIEGVNPMDTQPLVPFVLSASACRMISHALPKAKGRALPVLKTIALDADKTSVEEWATLAVTDLENPQVFHPRKVAGYFPDYESILSESEKGKAKVGFTLAVLERLVDTLKALDVRIFSMELRDAESPVRVEAKMEDGDVLAMIMPCKV